MVVELVVVSVVHIGLIRVDTVTCSTQGLYGLKLYLNATSGAIEIIFLGCRNMNQSEPSLICGQDV